MHPLFVPFAAALLLAPVAPERPLLRFEADAEAVSALVRRYASADDAALRQLARRPGGDRHPAIAALQTLAPAYGRDADATRLADRLLAAGLAEADALDEAALARRVDERGAQNPANLLAKQEAFYYAMRFHLKREERDARRAVALLTRFAEVIPRWPLVDRAGQAHSQGETAYYSTWDANGLWGGWYYSDLWASLPVLWAWDLAGSSEAMRAPGVSKRIEEGLLRYTVEFHYRFPPSYGNLEHYILDGMISYGKLLPEPEYIHRVVQWHHAVIATQFYADGFWHEGSPAYHKDIWMGMARTVPAKLKGYSDPPGFVSELDGTRFDDLDLGARCAPQFRRIEEGLNKLILPDGTVAGLHDCFEPGYKAWWARPAAESRPRLLGSSGHAILGMGAGSDQRQAHLHFGGMHGHEHYDGLSLLLWAKGHEAFSETMYRPLPGDISTREWHEATAAHNTVVVDESNQAGRFGNERRQLTPDDAVPGIPDGRYRAYGHGDSVSDGKLLLYEPTLDDIQVVEAGGEQSYLPRPGLYRRTLALVKVSEQDGYVLDVFRVRGGKTHDWMLHGCLQRPYDLTLSQPLQPRPGTLHKYLRDLQAFSTDGDVSAEFAVEGGPKTRVHLMGQPGTEVIRGMGPAMRRKGLAPFLDVRHPGPESVFVAVHDPGASLIRRVEFARLDDMAVAVRVELADGRVDLLVSTMDEAGAPARAVPAWGVSLRGRLAFARLREGRAERLCLVRGESFEAGGREVTGAVPFTGEIRATTRTEAGAPADTFTTSAPLPVGEALKGRALLLDLGGTLTRSVLVERVEGDRVFTPDDPGLTIQGDLIKLQHYPNWGIPGRCRYLVENPKVWPAPGD